MAALTIFGLLSALFFKFILSSTYGLTHVENNSTDLDPAWPSASARTSPKPWAAPRSSLRNRRSRSAP